MIIITGLVKLKTLRLIVKKILRLVLKFLRNYINKNGDKYKIFSTSSYGANPYSLGRLR